MVSNLKELHSDLLKTKLYFRSINLLFLSQVFISENLYGHYKRFSWVKIVKELNLDNIIKYFLFKISNMFLKKRVSNRFDYLFINDVYNKPVIDTLDSIQKEFHQEKTGVIYFDKRLGKPQPNVINGFEFSGPKVLLTSLIDVFRVIPLLYKSRSDILFISKKYRVSSFLLILNFFDSIFSINVIRMLLEKVQAPKVILMTDVHKLSRIVTLVSGEMKRRTFVIQHGATIGEEGYLPVTADHMLAWGEGSKRWFIDHYQPEQKIAMVGSPKMDNIQYAAPVINLKRSKITKALVVVSSITLEKPFLKAVRDAFRQGSFKNVEISVKLHPGMRVDYRHIVDEVFKGSELSYRIFHLENLKELLINSDIILITTSSVGMEAIVHNKPMYQFNAERLKDYKMDWENFDCSHLFDSSEKLFQLLSDPSIQYSKLQNYPAFIEHSFGKLDGHSSKRVKDFIVNNSLD